MQRKQIEIERESEKRERERGRKKEKDTESEWCLAGWQHSGYSVDMSKYSRFIYVNLLSDACIELVLPVLGQSVSESVSQSASRFDCGSTQTHACMGNLFHFFLCVFCYSIGPKSTNYNFGSVHFVPMLSFIL